MKINKLAEDGKGGKQNIRDSGLVDQSTDQVTRKAKDKSMPSKERNRYTLFPYDSVPVDTSTSGLTAYFPLALSLDPLAGFLFPTSPVGQTCVPGDGLSLSSLAPYSALKNCGGNTFYSSCPPTPAQATCVINAVNSDNQFMLPANVGQRPSLIPAHIAYLYWS